MRRSFSPLSVRLARNINSNDSDEQSLSGGKGAVSDGIDWGCDSGRKLVACDVRDGQGCGQEAEEHNLYVVGHSGV